MEPRWIGVDSSMLKRPGVPAERPPEPLARYEGGLPQQRSTAAVQVSVDRDAISPVFGATIEPKGLSGILRRKAYEISEHKARRWMLLLLADRIDVVESRLTGPTTERTRALLTVGLLSFAALVLMRNRAR